MNWKFADELYRMSCRVIKTTPERVKFTVRADRMVFCTVEVQGEIYELYTSSAMKRNTEINFIQCKQKLAEILERKDAPVNLDDKHRGEDEKTVVSYHRKDRLSNEYSLHRND